MLFPLPGSAGADNLSAPLAGSLPLISRDKALLTERENVIRSVAGCQGSGRCHLFGLVQTALATGLASDSLVEAPGSRNGPLWFENRRWCQEGATACEGDISLL